METNRNESPESEKFKEFLQSKTGKQLQDKLEHQLIAVESTRVSTLDQMKGYSIDIQQKEIREYARKNNIKIIAAFGGTNESAKTDERLELEKMLSFIKTSKVKVDVILVHKMDRFSRSGPNAIYIKEQLRKAGVFIQAVTQSVELGTPTGDLQQNLLLMFSHFDNQIRKDRTIEGIKAKLLDGEWPSKPNDGYVKKVIREGEKPVCVIDEKRADLIKFIFESVGYEGLTQLAVRRKLEDMGIKMTPQHISDILHNPFYCGYMEHGILDGQIVKGNHEPIISQELFLEVRNRLDKNPHGFKHNTENNSFPLKSLIHCHKCGYPFTGYIVPFGEKKYHYYKCPKKCAITVKAEYLHGVFKGELECLAIEPSLVPLIKNQLVNTFTQLNEQDVKNRKFFSTQLTEENKKFDKLKENLGQGIVPRQIYDELEVKYLQRIQHFEDELKKTEYDCYKIEKYLQKALDIASNMLNIWDSSDYSGRIRLQKLVFPNGLIYNPENDAVINGDTNIVFTQIARLSRGIELHEIKEIQEGGNTSSEGYYPTTSYKVFWRQFLDELYRIQQCSWILHDNIIFSGSNIYSSYYYSTGTTISNRTAYVSNDTYMPISASTLVNAYAVSLYNSGATFNISPIYSGSSLTSQTINL